MKILKINELPELKNETPSYVLDKIPKRILDIQSLPPAALNILNHCSGTILDVGPGEGISSMALATLFPDAQIIGLEMDHKHLVAAWPVCNTHPNLELFWGTLPSGPSNERVDKKLETEIPQLNPNTGVKYQHLFTWLGMSRKDIFENTLRWNQLIEKECLFVIPKFWHEGLECLSNEDLTTLKNFLHGLDLELPVFNKITNLSEFEKIESFPLTNTVKGNGWILWLSGFFDSLDISFWDTLTDRWRTHPLYQLPSIVFEMELLIAKPRKD